MGAAAETAAGTGVSTAAGICLQNSNSPAPTPLQTGAKGMLLPHMETDRYAAAGMMIGLLWRPAMAIGTGPETLTGLHMATGSVPGARTRGHMGTEGTTGLTMMAAAGVMSGAAGLGNLPGVALALVTGRTVSNQQHVFVLYATCACSDGRCSLVQSGCGCCLLYVDATEAGWPACYMHCSITANLSLVCALSQRVMPLCICTKVACRVYGVLLASPCSIPSLWYAHVVCMCCSCHLLLNTDAPVIGCFSVEVVTIHKHYSIG